MRWGGGFVLPSVEAVSREGPKSRGIVSKSFRSVTPPSSRNRKSEGSRGRKGRGVKLPDKTGSCGKLHRRCVGRMNQMFKENQASEKVN